MSGAESLHVRVISLVLALSVVVGAWLALEYNNHPPEPVASAHQTLEPTKAVEQTSGPTNPSTDSGDHSGQPQRDVNLMFKCQKNGRTSFSDIACDADAKTVSVTATDKFPPERVDRLAQMKRQVARMEADRLAREQAQAAVIASQVTAPEPNKAMQCKEVDDWIAYLDSQLRQPHGAQKGDYLTGERKKWMDKRFDLRC